MSEDQRLFIEEFVSEVSNVKGRVPNIVVLTGAGISAESGLQTFRASDGLWCNHRVEDVATPEAFVRDPNLVHKFYNERRIGLLSDDVAPNAAHEALGRLQDKWSGDVTIVTQNIDDLHERGGSKDVIHMHGEVLKSFCLYCRVKVEQVGDSTVNDVCPSCSKEGGMRPDIVWFGEMPYHMDDIDYRLTGADLFMSIGTSGNVYPAAGFVLMAANAGAKTVEVNLEPSLNAGVFTHGFYGPASIEVPKFVEMLINAVEKTGE